MLKKRIFWVLLIVNCQANAEIMTDGTLGNQVNLQAPNYEITQDLGTTIGPNLFHSFEQFNINSRETATFSGSSHIQNVISRVTGGNTSTINGVLRNSIPNADTYLINPNGILFGPEAQLDLQGSFHTSTADYLRLGENGRFDASHPSNSLLTVAPVEAFGFLDNTPSSIKVEGSRLIVPRSKTLSLVGGDLTIKSKTESTFSKNTGIVTFEAILFGESGQVNLVSLARGGEAKFTETGITLNSIDHGGQIEITNSGVGASGQEAGIISVQTGELILMNSVINSATLGNTDSGLIKVIANELTLIGDEHLTGVYTDTLSSGKSPNVEVEAKQINIIGTAAIFSMTHGAGKSGDVSLKAEHLDITGQFIPEVEAPNGVFTISPEENTGGAGNIKIDADQIIIDGGLILTYTEGQGNAGNIYIDADDTLDITGAFITEIEAPSGVLNATLSDGNAGDIIVNAGKIIFRQGGQILNRTFGAGNSGSIEVMVTGEIIASGLDSQNNHSGFTGEAGNDDIHNTGNAANIHIQADKITLLNGGGIESDTSGTGQGGRIYIQVNDSLIISGQDENTGAASSISASTLSQKEDAGDAGRIKVESGDIQLIDGGSIYNVTLGTGNSGAILVDVEDTLLIVGGFEIPSSREKLEQFRLLPSGIFTTSGSPEIDSGDSGQIDVRANQIILKEGGQINNDTYGEGDGGLIKISVAETLKSDGLYINKDGFVYFSGIRSSSHNEDDYAGNAGNLLIEAKNTIVTQDAEFSTEAANAEGGNITVGVSNLLLLRNNAYITTSVYGGTGDGGNITIEEPVFVTLDNSDIRAQANAGNGGNIYIIADNFLQTPCSVISASSRLGLDGRVEIDSPDETISGDLIQLPSNFKRPQHKIKTCRAKNRTERSHLTVKQLEGMPQNPEDLRSSFFVKIK